MLLKTICLAAALAVSATQVSSVASVKKKNWRVYTPPDRSFRIELPAPLREVMSFGAEHGASVEPDQKMEDGVCYAAIETTPGESRFGIVVLDGASTSLPAQERKKRLKYVGWFLIGDDDETQFMREPIEIRHHGLTGSEYIYVNDTEQNPLFTRGRIFDTGRKIYVLIFVGRDAADLTSPDAERFLNSFRLRGSKG